MSFTHPDQLHTAFATAFRAGDVAALVDLYEDDAVQVQPDGSVAGHAELADTFTRLLDAGVTLEGEPRRAVVAGGLALTSTRYTFDDDASGHPRHVATAEVSRQQPDGTWRLVVDAPSFA